MSSIFDRAAVGYAVAVEFSVRKDAEEAIYEEVRALAGRIPEDIASTWWNEKLRLESPVLSDMIRVRVGRFAKWESSIPKVRMAVLIVGERPSDKVCAEMEYLLFGTFAQSFRDPTLGRSNFVLTLGWVSGISAIGAVNGEPFER